MGVKKFIVRLTAEERERLKALVSKGRVSARKEKVAALRRLEVSDDPYLIGRSIRGTVRAGDDRSGALLIQLKELLRRGHSACFVDLVVARPVLRWHGPERLLVTWIAVQFVDARSFRMLEDQRTIGTGRVILGRG